MIPIMERQQPQQPGTGQQAPYMSGPMGTLPNWVGSNNPLSMLLQQHANNALSQPAQGQVTPTPTLGGANGLSSLFGTNGQFQFPGNLLQLLFGGMRQ